MSFDNPRRRRTIADAPDNDPLVVFQCAVDQAMKDKASTEPHLITSGPWMKTEPHLGTYREVRVWRGDRGGPRTRVTTVTDREGGTSRSSNVVIWRRRRF